jgi:hypothetical protein
MRRRRITALVAVAALIILAALLLSPSKERKVRGHLRGWRESLENTSNGRRIPFPERVLHFVQDKGMSSSWYWTLKMMEHEAALLHLGYLTNFEFRLTNQVITREFSSNFFRSIHLRAGMNEDQVWRSPYLTNRTGLTPTFPSKDYAIWEQTFRECALRYASNLPPASMTSDGPRGTE